jgi:hypothetical protein
VSNMGLTINLAWVWQQTCEYNDRYTLWLRWEGAKLAPDWDGDFAEEL